MVKLPFIGILKINNPSDRDYIPPKNIIIILLHCSRRFHAVFTKKTNRIYKKDMLLLTTA